MENFIYYYYNIEIDTVIKQDNYYYLSNEQDIFYFCETGRTEDDITKINTIIRNMHLENNFHSLILNRYNLFVSEYNEKKYCLIKINGLLNNTYDMKSLLSFSYPLLNINLMNNWGLIWSKKIDYMEEQIKSLGLGKKVLIESFSYYVGLTENAISYYNQNKIVSSNISLCHYRLYYPNKAVDFLNPLSLVIDYKMRDYAEYIKSIFFIDLDLAYKETNIFLESNQFNNNDLILFWNRLLYPSYYFDCFEDSIGTIDYDEKKIINIISKQDSYEKYLVDTYYEIKKRVYLPEISWLLKKK